MRRREFLLTATAAALPAKERLVLARHGESPYSICLPEDAIPAERRGAEELQRVLEQISGVRLPVATGSAKPRGDRIVLRHTTEFGTEGFALKTEGREIVISGGRPRGTMYGVYSFLEKLGVRWFTPEVTRVPRMRTVGVGPLDEIQQPAFEYREVYFTEACDKDWAARNKTNGNLSRLDDSTGGKVEYYPFVHSFAELIPPEKHFGEHPEYFSLVGGIRTADDAQLCLSNPEVLRVAIGSVSGWIEQHPQATIFSVSQNDNQRYCECDACRRIEQDEGGAHSGPILRFVNAIAAEIGKKHPDKLIDTLAYQYSEDPPEKVRPRPNVRIRLCPIGACQSHPYEKCAQNASVVRNLRSWSKITNQLYVWHYVTNFANYLLPFPDFDELAADLPMYRRNGVVGLFLEGAYPKGGGGENAELRSYVMARLMWDTNAGVEQAVNEFLAGVYGERAAKPMREWFDLLHREVELPPHGGGQHIWTYTSPRLSDRLLDRSQTLFRRAESAAADDAARGRVRKARLAVDYAALLRAKTFSLRGSVYGPADLPGLKDRFESFLAAVRQHGITSLHEGRDLEEDEREFAAMVKPYSAAVIESDVARAVIVPELSGRAISLVHKATGRDALRHAGPEERNYPDQGGALFALYRDDSGRERFSIFWDLAEASRGSATLTGTCENGLRIERRYWLDGTRLHAATRINPNGSGPSNFAVLLRAEFHAADAVLRASGFETHMLPAGERGDGAQTLSGPEIRDGEWSVESRSSGVTLAQHFDPELVERCLVSWRGRGEDRVTLSVWSKPQTLQFDTSYEINAG